MFNTFIDTMKNYKMAYLKGDIQSGVVVAALTIPVAMGYAQIAGLPPIYGLYASFLPVLAYTLFASNPQLIFGIDATGSAFTASMISLANIAPESNDALLFVPLLAISTAIFLMIFSVLKLSKLIKYISSPVMSGFISGLGIAIIAGQIPKILGLKSAGMDFLKNNEIIVNNISKVNTVAVVLGIVSILIIVIGSRVSRKIPWPLIVLIIGTILSTIIRFDNYGVTIIGDIPQGLPPLSIPTKMPMEWLTYIIGGGFISAIICAASSLLTSKSFALEGDYKTNDDQELFAYGISNFVSGLSGCLPTSASVSRSAVNVAFGGKTQLTSVFATVTIGLVLLFFSDLLYFTPQPVLSAIIFCSLINIVAIGFFKRLYQRTKTEAFIWFATLLGVLLVGTLFGVILGVILSFILIILSSSLSVSRSFLGKRKGLNGYYDLKRYEDVEPLSGIMIYRFSNSLSFANIGIFISDIDNKIDDTTRAVIIDASAVSSIDTTASDSLAKFCRHLERKKIDYYFANTIGIFRDDLRKHGFGMLLEDDHAIKTIDEIIARY